MAGPIHSEPTVGWCRITSGVNERRPSMLAAIGQCADSGRCEADATRPATAAFVLIELLLVVAIIAILAAMILAALSRSKQEGYIADCQSNLHQIGVAIELYTGDFNAYPLYLVIPPDGQTAILWHDRLAPYAHAKWTTNLGGGIADSTSQLYLCPAYPQAVGNPPLWPYIGDGWENYGPYGYNAHGVGSDLTNEPLGLGGLSIDGSNAPPTKDADIVSTSYMIAVADSDFIGYWNAPAGPFIPGAIAGSAVLNFGFEVNVVYGHGTPGTGLQTSYNAELARHSGARRNVVFCDGHVEILQPLQLYDYTNAQVLSLWNKDHQPHPNSIPPPL